MVNYILSNMRADHAIIIALTIIFIIVGLVASSVIAMIFDDIQNHSDENEDNYDRE